MKVPTNNSAERAGNGHVSIEPKSTTTSIHKTELYPRLNDFCDGKYFHKSWLKPNIPTTKVPQGKAKASTEQLTTTGLGSCCAAGFHYNGINFLTHVDAVTNPEVIKSEITQNFDIESLRKDIDLQICFWEGAMGSTQYATNIIGQALENLGLLDKMVFTGNVESHMKTVGVNERGTFEHTPETSERHDSSGGTRSKFLARFKVSL